MWYIILGFLTAVYLLIYFVIPGTLGGFIESYVIRPVLWISLAIIVFLISKQEGLEIWKFKKVRKWQIGKTPFHAGMLFGGFQVSLLVIAGLLFGFGQSPYSHEVYGIITNTLFFASSLVAIELTRSYLIKKGTSMRKNITINLLLISLLFMVINIAPTSFAQLTFSNPAATAKFIGQGMIPVIAMSLFASYLAYLGGALPAIAYMGTIQAFEWYSPLLPDLDWALLGLIGTIGPAIGFLIIQSDIQITHGRQRRTNIKDPAVAWTGIAIVSLFIVFFSFGYLGAQPSIIYSGSMSPNLEVGDIVLVSDVDANDIEIGDIIQFKIENMSIPIIHRVYDIEKEEENFLFITKGDANSAPDITPISSGHIMGKVVFNIPKIGWISIGIKEIFNKIGFSI